MTDKEIKSFKRKLPKHKKKQITDEVIEMINSQDFDEFKDDIFGYVTVLQKHGNRYTIPQYLKAVKFVNMLSVCNVSEAYRLTFPEKVAEWEARDVSQQYIDVYAGKYNRRQLITEIKKIATIPFKLMNADVLQKAVNHSVTLMYGANSELVQQKAAESLMKYLAPDPETTQQIDVNINADNSINELKKTIMDLSSQQVNTIKAGTTSVKQIAEMNIIEVEAE